MNPIAGLPLVGGPSAILETRGLRLLTDPSFDPPAANTQLDRPPSKRPPGRLSSPKQLVISKPCCWVTTSIYASGDAVW